MLRFSSQLISRQILSSRSLGGISGVSGRMGRVGARSIHATSALYNRRILISDPIQKPCVDILQSAGYEVTQTEKVPSEKELMELVRGYDGLIVRSGTKVTANVVNAADKLSLIGRAGAGVDNIDIDAATKKGTMVMNTPGGNSASAAELTVSLIMAMSRQIPEATQSLKEGRWDRKKFMGTELNGKTVGVVGLGAIGRRVAKACQALGMHVLGYDPLLSKNLAEQGGIEPVDIDALIERSDLITLHTPLNADTRHLLNRESFKRCKDGVRIVNCARGGIVHEGDLLEALKSGKVAAAALDVFESEPPTEASKELLAHPNLICTPHLGANTGEAQARVAVDIAKQFVDAFEGRQMVGVVNSRILAELAARKELHSYIELSERIGSLQGQLLQGRLKRIELRTRGDELKDSSSLLRAAALKGVLSQLVQESVNYVNAPGLAEEFGLRVEEVHENRPSVHGTSLTVTFETEKGSRKLVGTVLQGNKPRIVQVDDFNLELSPEGDLVFFKNRDRPGFLSAVTGILGKKGINISTLALGRINAGGIAVGCLGLDSRLDEATCKELEKMDQLEWLHPATLPPLGDHGTILAGGVLDDTKPTARPRDPNFSSGPCKKRPGYKVSELPVNALGRSHRSKVGLQRLKEVIHKSRTLLNVPDDYLVGIVPASDTGAFEMAMWSLLGERPVDVCHWESFGKGWMSDITSQLKLDQVREFKADYGELPDLTQTNSDHDIVFTWNGTTSGVKVPDGDWIAEDRKGLTLCDATSAVFAMDLPWKKLDVVTYSWQKALGSEGAHGMLILSPRAVERLNSFAPDRPLPKIFRLTKKGKLSNDVFEGKVINTPSLLAAEDCIDALNWVESEGGLSAAIERSNRNLNVLTNFVQDRPWINFLAQDEKIRSNTSVCLTLDLSAEKVKKLTALLEKEGVAYDIGSYRDAPNGLRIWTGCTVESGDVARLCDWIEWAYNKVK